MDRPRLGQRYGVRYRGTLQVRYRGTLQVRTAATARRKSDEVPLSGWATYDEPMRELYRNWGYY